MMLKFHITSLYRRFHFLTVDDGEDVKDLKVWRWMMGADAGNTPTIIIVTTTTTRPQWSYWVSGFLKPSVHYNGL